MAPEQVWEAVSTANTGKSGRVNRLIVTWIYVRFSFSDKALRRYGTALGRQVELLQSLVADWSAPGAPDWIEEERQS